MTGSSSARSVLAAGAGAIAVLVATSLGLRFELWGGVVSGLVGGGAIVLAIVALVRGIRALRAAIRHGLRGDIAGLGAGVAMGLGVLGLFAVLTYQSLAVPPIHNITTDTVDAPVFDVIASIRPAGSNPFTYDPARPVGDSTLAELQRRQWPELTSLRSSLPPPAALDRAHRILSDMGMDIVNVDRERGLVEAIATTPMGFKDDVVIRVRPDGAGSVVDGRSVSRMGASDAGKNAARLLHFIERFSRVD